MELIRQLLLQQARRKFVGGDGGFFFSFVLFFLPPKHRRGRSISPLFSDGMWFLRWDSRGSQPMYNRHVTTREGRLH